jgi:polar amino acid transport system substrate-binding protein
MAKIQQRGYLLVGIDQNTPGFSVRSADRSRIEGFEYDILRQIARAIFGDDNPNRIRPVALTTAQRVDAVHAGKVDLAASLITHTCDRDVKVAFSHTYFIAHQDLLVPKDSNITTPADVKGRRVCATRSSTSLTRIRKLGAVPYPVATRADCLVALQDGRVDAITSDDTVLAAFLAQDPTTHVLGANLEQEPYAVAVGKKHTDLAEFINGVLAQMNGPDCKATVCLSDLARQWLAPLRINDPLPTGG